MKKKPQFRQGKIIKIFETNGKRITLRYPKMSDMNDLLEYINSLIDERARILLTKRITRKKEEAYMKEMIKKNRKGLEISVVAEADKRVVANSSIFRRMEPPTAVDHTAEIAIGVKREYRRMGIASELIKTLIDLAREQWGTEIVKLSYISDNTNAKNLYERQGFVETGRIRRGYKRDGEYLDDVLMIKELKS